MLERVRMRVIVGCVCEGDGREGAYVGDGRVCEGGVGDSCV